MGLCARKVGCWQQMKVEGSEPWGWAGEQGYVIKNTQNHYGHIQMFYLCWGKSIQAFKSFLPEEKWLFPK